MIASGRRQWLVCLALLGCETPAAGPVVDGSITLDGSQPSDGPPLVDDGEGVPDAAVRACNGTPHLCPRRYDQVSYPTTHNAMSSVEREWWAPNQTFAVPRQLEDGVRGLMLDLHYGPEGEVLLCHGECDFGAQPATEGFAEIDAFLGANPHEVVTLIFESYVTPADLNASLAASGLSARLHLQTADSAWPTLAAMIDADTRLVILTDVRPDPEYREQHYVWDYAWETHWQAQRPEDLACAPNRGDPAHSLFILNHFLTYPIAFPHLAETVNYSPGFLERARDCMEAGGQLPNFVVVDFYEIGDVLTVVATLNAP